NLKWCEGYPSDVAEPEAEACSAAPTEEGHERRRPVMPHADCAGIPEPSVIRLPEPAAIVIRSPTPRVSADPRPAIPIFPSPAARAIRGPAGRDRWPPAVAVIGNVGPGTVAVQILHAGYALRYVLIIGI